MLLREKNQLVVNGYEFKTASESVEPPSKRPNVGMFKRNIAMTHRESASDEGGIPTSRIQLVPYNETPTSRIQLVPYNETPTNSNKRKGRKNNTPRQNIAPTEDCATHQRQVEQLRAPPDLPTDSNFGIPSPCWCRTEAVPRSLRSRTHFHCDWPGCGFATDRDGRLRNHKDTHRGENERAPCWCANKNSGAASGTKHFHCRYCAKVYDRVDRVGSHELTHARNSQGGKAPARLYGAPSISRPAQWYADRLIKPDVFQHAAGFPRRDMIRWSLGIRDPYTIPDDVHTLPAWRRIFKTKDFLIDAFGAPQLILVYDITPSFWVFQSKKRRRYSPSRGIGRCLLLSPRWFFYSTICATRVVHFHGFVNSGGSQEVSTTRMEFVRAIIHIFGTAP